MKIQCIPFQPVTPLSLFIEILEVRAWWPVRSWEPWPKSHCFLCSHVWFPLLHWLLTVVVSWLSGPLSIQQTGTGSVILYGLVDVIGEYDEEEDCQLHHLLEADSTCPFLVTYSKPVKGMLGWLRWESILNWYLLHFFEMRFSGSSMP